MDERIQEIFESGKTGAQKELLAQLYFGKSAEQLFGKYQKRLKRQLVLEPRSLKCPGRVTRVCCDSDGTLRVGVVFEYMDADTAKQYASIPGVCFDEGRIGLSGRPLLMTADVTFFPQECGGRLYGEIMSSVKKYVFP